MCRFCERGLSIQHFKRCSYCGEMIRNSAVKCRFCACDVTKPPGGKQGDTFLKALKSAANTLAHVDLDLAPPGSEQDYGQSQTGGTP